MYTIKNDVITFENKEDYNEINNLNLSGLNIISLNYKDRTLLHFCHISHRKDRESILKNGIKLEKCKRELIGPGIYVVDWDNPDGVRNMLLNFDEMFDRSQEIDIFFGTYNGEYLRVPDDDELDGGFCIIKENLKVDEFQEFSDFVLENRIKELLGEDKTIDFASILYSSTQIKCFQKQIINWNSADDLQFILDNFNKIFHGDFDKFYIGFGKYRGTYISHKHFLNLYSNFDLFYDKIIKMNKDILTQRINELQKETK
jgi:hypothetical protein